MKFCLILLLSLFSTTAVGQYTVTSVQNPKDDGTNGYISNPDTIITAEDVERLNTVCFEIEDKDSFQVAFVILKSIGEEVPKDFGLELFNTWGLGHYKRNDGLLVLFVLDQRRIEFVTGYGTETVLSDSRCVEIQQEYMVPNFRNEEYAIGLYEGATALQEELRGKIVKPHEVTIDQPVKIEYQPIELRDQ
jgi:uncharacterized protein